MEIDEEYIDKVKSLIEQKDAENVKTHFDRSSPGGYCRTVQ